MSILEDRVAEVISTKHQVELALGYLRYETVRKLNPRRYADLWMKPLFDDSIDGLIEHGMDYGRVQPR